MTEETIIVYSSPTCPQCFVLKQKLSKKNIKFIEEHDVAKMEALGINHIPMLSINGELKTFMEASSWVDAQSKRNNVVKEQ